MMEPAPGMLLVAQPELEDPNFIRSVVYLLEFHHGGAMGLIINRPLDMPLGALWEACPADLEDRRCCGSGGPVEVHKGLLLHGFAGVAETFELGEGVYIGGDPQQLIARLGAQSSAMAGTQGPRLFLGHAGWSAEQLREEIRSGSWLLRRGHPRLLLDPHPDADLWSSLLSAGEEPPPPQMN